MDLGGRSLKGQMKQADRLEASWTVIIGPDEWSRESGGLRDMRGQAQEDVALGIAARGVAPAGGGFR